MNEQPYAGRRRLLAAPVAALVTATAVLACPCAPALATTVGGLSTYGSGPFALVGGRLFTPTFLTNNAGEGAPGPGPPVTEMQTNVQSFASGKHGARALTLDDSTAGSAPAALAASAGRLATAWVGAHGFQSALVTASGAALRTPVTFTVSGTVEGYVAAIDSSGARAVMWLDSVGVRLQTVSPAGVVGVAVTLAGGASSFYSLNSDDAGGWWAVWIAGSRVVATDVAAGGTTVGPIVLGGAPARPAGARMLHPRLWSAVADGHGGLWVGLPDALLRVERTGAVERRSVRKPILAEGDGRTALAEDLGDGTVLVRPVGRAGRLLRVRHIGSLLDIAYDGSRQQADLLSAVARGRVELTTLSRRGRIVSTPVRGCPRAGAGELVASGGLVGVACAGRPFEAESVETGGDVKSGRYVHYYLLRDAHRLNGEAFFEGLYAY